MARSHKEIYNIITSTYISNEAVVERYELDTESTFDEQFSVVSFERIFFNILAAIHYMVEVIFDKHKSEVDSTIEKRDPHTREWMQQLALNFRYGYAIDSNTKKYSDEAIADLDAAVVKYAACTKEGTVLYLKIAGEGTDGLGKLPDEQQIAFDAYFEETSDAGVFYKRVNEEADCLRTVIDIFYNPQILDDKGRRLDGTNDTPLQDAIKTYLQNLPFNGEFSVTAFTDALQKVDGVVLPTVFSAEVKYGVQDWHIVKNLYVPYSGWLKIYNLELDLTPNWHAYLSE